MHSHDYCAWVLQLTESPDGGCHVEHQLKVQPVLDAPALFSKLLCSNYFQLLLISQLAVLCWLFDNVAAGCLALAGDTDELGIR